MHPSSNNGQQQHVGKTHLDEQQQTLLLLQQLGSMGWPVHSVLQNIGRGQDQQQTDLLKQFMKTQPATNFSSDQQQQQRIPVERELTQKRPSLMHDFGANQTQSTRYSLIQPHLQQQQSQMNHSMGGIGFNFTSEMSYLTEEEEKYKRMLNEKLEKIDRERSQATIMQKNAEKKAKVCRQKLLDITKHGSSSGGINDNEDNDEDRDDQSPTETLIERIYAENRRKAIEAAPLPSTSKHTQSTNHALMTEDAARLRAEYERGVQLLPMLVQAMRIQRERREDALERRRIIYEEQLNTWERKVTAYEKNPKKLARDVKHRELFEKTFIELKKMREEKERNSRVERSRISLAQGGNGIGAIIPSTSTQIQMNDQNEADLGEDRLEQKQHEIDEKVYQAALVPPIFSNPPRRFFDNRNGLVDNSLAETQKQLEIFQNVWTDTEKAVFTEKIALYGKNFAAIAAFLPTKTVRECVQFYYMTKKRNNYKQKFGRRRKKIGRQGYRPPIMPRFGDTNENIQNYGKGGMFVECLLCDSRILVLESLAQQTQHFDEFGSPTPQFSLQQEIPICTKCQSTAQRNKSLNRCPLGSCICIGGKRKMKPARNIPEKFTTLEVDKKRFIIYRLKLPPSTNKCCTHCYKRIAKDIEDLLLGELQSEFDTFKMKTEARKQQEPKQVLLTCGGDEEEDTMETKQLVMDELWTTRILEEQGSSLKGAKMEVKETEKIEIKKEILLEENNQQEMEPFILPRQGSITRGTPNRVRNILLGSSNDGNTLDQNIPPIIPNLFGLLKESESTEEQTMGKAETDNEAATTAKIHDMLAHFGFTSDSHSKEATMELTRQLSQLSSLDGSLALPSEWLNNLQIQPLSLQQQQQQQQQQTLKIEIDTKKTSQEPQNETAKSTFGSESQEADQSRRNSESLRRKSGLATVILPSPIPPESSSSSSSIGVNRLTSSTRTTVSPAILSFTIAGDSVEKEKPLLEQRDSNLTTNSNDTAATKTESNHGQLSSCYESLSDDSDHEDKATEITPEKEENQTGLSSAFPAFFTVFDFPEEDSTEGGSQNTPEITANNVTTTMTPRTDTAQTQSVPDQLAMIKINTGTKTVDEIAGNNGNKPNPIYEPLSSDDEN